MSNNYSINLLPWRLYAHRQKRRKFFLIILSCLLVLINYGFFIQYHTQKLIQNSQNLTLQQQQDKQQLNRLKQQSQQMRQQLPAATEVKGIDYAQIEQLFKFIEQTPLNLGEFNLLKLQVDEQQVTVSLQGLTPASEFEAIHQLLKQQEWLAQIHLTHFIPQPTTWISFEFHLLLTKS